MSDGDEELRCLHGGNKGRRSISFLPQDIGTKPDVGENLQQTQDVSVLNIRFSLLSKYEGQEPK